MQGGSLSSQQLEPSDLRYRNDREAIDIDSRARQAMQDREREAANAMQLDSLIERCVDLKKE